MSLRTTARRLVKALNELGFDNDEASVSGADCVDVVARYLPDLEAEAGEDNGRPDNVEFVTEMMEWSQQGPAAQLFIMEAIRRYAEQVAPLTPEELGAVPLVGAGRWIAVAKDIQAKMKERGL